jgi:NTE family protein
MRGVRELRARRSPKTAFVLGGGGNLGAIQVGMLRALLARGVVPDLLVGCSVGALNAAALAVSPTSEGVHRLETLWSTLRGEDVCPTGRLSGPWQLALPGEGLYSNDGLRKLIERFLPFRRLEDAHVPLHVVATSLRTGAETWFSTGPAVDAILASAALPAAFPPVRINGELYIDGAVVNNVPISKAVELGAVRIYVLHVGNFERPRPDPRRPLDVLVQSFSIARNHRFQFESQLGYPGVEVIILPGVDPGPVKFNDFTRTREMIERGHGVTTAFLDAGAVATVGLTS